MLPATASPHPWDTSPLLPSLSATPSADPGLRDRCPSTAGALGGLLHRPGDPTLHRCKPRPDNFGDRDTTAQALDREPQASAAATASSPTALSPRRSHPRARESHLRSAPAPGTTWPRCTSLPGCPAQI